MPLIWYNYLTSWGSYWFRHVLLGMIASSWQTINVLKINNKNNNEAAYGFTPVFA